MKLRYLIVVGLLLAISASLLLFLRVPREPQFPLPQGLQHADLELAQSAARSQRGLSSQHQEALVWMQLGQWAFEKQQFQAAAECYAHIADDLPLSFQVRAREGETQFRRHQAQSAEMSLRKAVQLSQDAAARQLPEWYGARDWLRHLMELELRYEDRQAVLREIHQQQGRPSLFDSAAYCFPSLLRWNGDDSISKLEPFYQQAPSDPHLRLAVVRYRIGEGRLSDAEALIQSDDWGNVDLRRVAAVRMEYFEAVGAWAEMSAVLDALPPVASDDPWLLSEKRGRCAAHRQDWSAAESAYKQLLKSDPSNAAACLGLVDVYKALGQSDDAATMRQRSERLAQIRNRLGQVLITTDADALVTIAEMSLELKLNEAAQWMIYHALLKAPQHARARQLRDTLNHDKS